MTAPAHPDRQGTREELADVLAGWAVGGDYYQYTLTTDDAGEIADALLPVVERLCDQRAAEALEAAAELQALAMRDFDLARWLRARARALRPAATRENGAGA